ncbi:hypothetical protein Tco_0669811 [Tanacetum coccineum]
MTSLNRSLGLWISKGSELVVGRRKLFLKPTKLVPSCFFEHGCGNGIRLPARMRASHLHLYVSEIKQLGIKGWKIMALSLSRFG